MRRALAAAPLALFGARRQCGPAGCGPSAQMKEAAGLNTTGTSNVSPDNTDTSRKVPGDTFGLFETRLPFYRPLERRHHDPEFAAMFPHDASPDVCVAPGTVKELAARFGITKKQAAWAVVDNGHDVNLAVQHIAAKTQQKPPFGSYGLVALEAYDPEAFCLVKFTCPDLETTRDPDVLELMHELVLSAAEMPVDLSSRDLVHRFLTEWTTDGGERCGDLLQQAGLGVTDILILPYGEYSVQGMFVANPVSEDFPNIGTGAAATCLDLRSGIHSRFRFHAERIADTVAEHVAREKVHFGQEVHLLKQPFLWDPEYSIEDFIRYKESLLQPSALCFELRYMAMHHWGPELPFRNIVELERLKTMQHKLDKHYKTGATPGKVFSSDTGVSPPLGAAGGMQAGGGYYGSKGRDAFLDAEATEESLLTRAYTISNDERIWSTFYRNNYY